MLAAAYHPVVPSGLRDGLHALSYRPK